MNRQELRAMNKCACKQTIPQGRIDLGYKTCVDCSSVEAYGCVGISNHKTGNTIQILPKEVAENINRLSARKGYGVMTGMKHN